MNLKRRSDKWQWIWQCDDLRLWLLVRTPWFGFFFGCGWEFYNMVQNSFDEGRRMAGYLGRNRWKFKKENTRHATFTSR